MAFDISYCILLKRYTVLCCTDKKYNNKGCGIYEKLVPHKGADKRYHVSGALRIVKKSEFRELFTKALECLKKAKGKMIVLWVPLPRYLFEKCCTDPLHITNKGEEGYERAMRDILEEMASWMANLADMRRIKDVVIYNPMVPLGLLDDEADEEHILRLWGPDPVQCAPY
jgi:hypothetical protein